MDWDRLAAELLGDADIGLGIRWLKADTVLGLLPMRSGVH